MTYTTERAHEIKDKFIHRIKQHYSTTKTSRDLSADERSAILHDILYEQQTEWRMKRECEMQKRCRQNEVFELFKRRMDEKQRDTMEEEEGGVSIDDGFYNVVEVSSEQEEEVGSSNVLTKDSTAEEEGT